MEIFAGGSVGLLILAAGVVAIRTFALWRRTRELPELLLSMMLLCATVLGYPLAIAMTLIPASEMWPIHLAAQLSLSLGFVFLLLFTLKVFRPNSRWAKGLVALCMCAFAGITVAYAVALTGENPRGPGEMVALTICNCIPAAVAYFWTTFESLRYYGLLRLRLRLGLSDVVVANRVLLWGLMTLAAGIALLINVAALVAGSFLSAPVVLVSSMLGVVHATCLFLAFHPPRRYEIWLEQRAAVQSA